MSKVYGVDQDNMGFYAYWGQGYERKETLRTRDKAKASLWLYRGNCHGHNRHEIACKHCERVTREDFAEAEDKQGTSK